MDNAIARYSKFKLYKWTQVLRNFKFYSVIATGDKDLSDAERKSISQYYMDRYARSKVTAPAIVDNYESVKIDEYPMDDATMEYFFTHNTTFNDDSIKFDDIGDNVELLGMRLKKMNPTSKFVIITLIVVVMLLVLIFILVNLVKRALFPG